MQKCLKHPKLGIEERGKLTLGAGNRLGIPRFLDHLLMLRRVKFREVDDLFQFMR